MSLENVKHIVLILSGKGGVGKSSTTTQLALSLSLAGKSVGILDIDLTGPSIPRLLGLESSKIKQAPGGWIPVRVHDAQTLPSYPRPSSPRPSSPRPSSPRPSSPRPSSPRPSSPQKSATHETTSGHPSNEEEATTTAPDPATPTTTPLIGSLDAISLAFLLPSRSSAVIWRGPKKTAMVRQFLTDVLWPPIDYLLIDSPPGTSDEHISLIETLLTKTTTTPPPKTAPTPSPTPTTTTTPPQHLPHLAGALLVTTPQAISTADVRKELSFCVKTGVPVLGIVENMSGYACECCGEVAELFGRGGGREMGREFGVRVLGEVPVEGGWGVVVEEGGWGGFGRGEGGDVGGEGDAGALLVDRYRSCALSRVFEGIAREVVGIVEGGEVVGE